ncbi:hypothetical protein H4R18_001097 [Coemansia javaensis]|uniref:Uncharacterized protein n=1 Tax=Coemansia javaensis TaxID=2761396 RepID=A0A9W8HKQ9_9FUNG|nr:hypothetical protein H4R18_001097 [Coemansia javaensis]
MRPDPYKKKASRRYQAAHPGGSGGKRGEDPGPDATDAAAQPSSAGRRRAPHAAQGATTTTDRRYAPRPIQSNAERHAAAAASLEDSAAPDEQDAVREFLRHLEDGAQAAAAEHSAAYFRLRAEAEAESSVLGARGDGAWSQLTEVGWDRLLDAAGTLPLHELLGVDSSTPLPPEASAQPPPPEASAQPRPAAQVPVRKLDAADLAPGIAAPRVAKPAPKPPAAPGPAKPTQSVDDMEAFLDNLL